MSKFNFKKTTVTSDDPNYDLLTGGHIDPKKMLIYADQIAEVENAVEIIRNFLEQAEAAGVLELC